MPKLFNLNLKLSIGSKIVSISLHLSMLDMHRVLHLPFLPLPLGNKGVMSIHQKAWLKVAISIIDSTSYDANWS